MANYFDLTGKKAIIIGGAGSEWGHKRRRNAPIAGGMGQATVIEMCE